MKNNKKLIVIGIIFLIIILIATLVFALFTARKEETEKINIGNIEVILLEDWPDPDDVDEAGIDRNTKTVWGESVADNKAYVRMRFIPVVEYFYKGKENGEAIEEWRTAPISQDYINIKFSGEENWIRQGEYFYYKNILNPGETTENLELQWDILEFPSGLEQYENVRTDVRVLLEYSQVSNDMWKEIFQIEDLPAGIER